MKLKIIIFVTIILQSLLICFVTGCSKINDSKDENNGEQQNDEPCFNTVGKEDLSSVFSTIKVIVIFLHFLYRWRQTWWRIFCIKRRF